MVDTVATQTLLDGERLVIQKFTNISDGTGETGVNKVIVANLAPNFQGMDFEGFGGLTNNSGAGKTGNIAFTTSDQSAGDMYTIVLECIKTYG